MRLVTRLMENLSSRPRFEVRVVPVLDDVRAVLWVEIPAGTAISCRALFEFDPIPGTTPHLREDWSDGVRRGPAASPAKVGPIAVPPRTQFDPETLSNPRFRVKWTTPTGKKRETIVPVFS
jgi:hypothetical protein